ncbi:hypothetical protein PLESTB_001359500 [Pleodorina starrii]|uniref:Uncharacterized protein n=1 Tax=Pleodorina starrii TaxID=330485 RepID=A0A9W6BUG2_9CHLO|nr:hypothetical protein PLESTB_001359500 [Pleodorina starrii]
MAPPNAGRAAGGGDVKITYAANDLDCDTLRHSAPAVRLAPCASARRPLCFRFRFRRPGADGKDDDDGGGGDEDGAGPDASRGVVPGPAWSDGERRRP